QQREGAGVPLATVGFGPKVLHLLEGLLIAAAAVVDQRLGENALAVPAIIFRAPDDATRKPLDARKIWHRFWHQCARLGRLFRSTWVLFGELLETIEYLPAGAAVAIDVAKE